MRRISNLGFAIWNVKEYRIEGLEILRDCNWDYGLWDKGYEKIEIKKLETGRDKWR